MKAVEITRPGRIRPSRSQTSGESLWVAKPADEIEDIRVAPHPLWEAEEAAEGIARLSGARPPAHVPVHAIGIGPVGLRGDRAEALLGDQALRDLGPNPIELVRTVRRLSEQDVARRADALQHRPEVLGFAGQPAGHRSTAAMTGLSRAAGHAGARHTAPAFASHDRFPRTSEAPPAPRRPWSA